MICLPHRGFGIGANSRECVILAEMSKHSFFVSSSQVGNDRCRRFTSNCIQARNAVFFPFIFTNL